MGEKMARPAGIEPAIFGSGGRRLIHWATSAWDYRNHAMLNTMKTNTNSLIPLSPSLFQVFFKNSDGVPANQVMAQATRRQRSS